MRCRQANGSRGAASHWRLLLSDGSFPRYYLLRQGERQTGWEFTSFNGGDAAPNAVKKTIPSNHAKSVYCGSDSHLRY